MVHLILYSWYSKLGIVEGKVDFAQGSYKCHSCGGCKRKIKNFDEIKVVVTCTACNLFQKTSKVSKQWVVKFSLVEHKVNSNRFQLTAFYAVVSQLMTTLGLPDDTKENDSIIILFMTQ